MIEAWGSQEVYAAETALMDTLPEGGLMARAVEGLLAVVRARIAQRGARRVVGLVGTGNNGADALYTLAHLAAEGHPVAAVTTDRVHEDASRAALESGVVLVTGPQAVPTVADADLVLDGVLGIGGRPQVPGFAAPWVAAIADDA